METAKTYIENDKIMDTSIPWDTLEFYMAKCCASKDGVFKWYTFNQALGENQAEAKRFTFNFEEFKYYWEAPFAAVGIEEFTMYSEPKFFEIW